MCTSPLRVKMEKGFLSPVHDAGMHPEAKHPIGLKARIYGECIGASCADPQPQWPGRLQLVVRVDHPGICELIGFHRTQ